MGVCCLGLGIVCTVLALAPSGRSVAREFLAAPALLTFLSGITLLARALFMKLLRRCCLRLRTFERESLAWTHTDIVFFRRVVTSLATALADRR